MTAHPADVPIATEKPPWHAAALVLLAAALSLGWFALDGKVGLNLADEGYLWYGAQAVARGEVPMRDFQAYDPGRYLWVAGWSRWLGQDVVGLRLACVFFQILGVSAGLLVAWRLSRHWLFLLGVGLLLCAWMHPRYKCYEQSIALMSVYVAVLLLERPTAHRHFRAGIFGGLMAVMGRNHGVYHLVAFALLIVLAARGAGVRAWVRGTLAWMLGLGIGYLPQLLMFKAIPGYFAEFQRYVQAILAKGTNLLLAVPWPWRVDAALPNWRWAAALLEGCFFLALPAFVALALVRLCRRAPAPRVLAATACVTLPYMHFAFSRPDTVHLGHAAPTLVLGILALGGRWRPIFTPVLLGASLLTNAFQSGLAARIFPGQPALEEVTVQGRALHVGAPEAQWLRAAERLSREVATPEERILFLPNLPGLYPATGLRSPTRQIYFIFPASLEDQGRIITEIESAKVPWVMQRDYALDGRDDLRFRQTHPLIAAHLERYFAPFAMEGLPPDTTILRRRAAPRR
jgi:hypothetical protein